MTTGYRAATHPEPNAVLAVLMCMVAMAFSFATLGRFIFFNCDEQNRKKAVSALYWTLAVQTLSIILICKWMNVNSAETFTVWYCLFVLAIIYVTDNYYIVGSGTIDIHEWSEDDFLYMSMRLCANYFLGIGIFLTLTSAD